MVFCIYTWLKWTDLNEKPFANEIHQPKYTPLSKNAATATKEKTSIETLNKAPQSLTEFSDKPTDAVSRIAPYSCTIS